MINKVLLSLKLGKTDKEVFNPKVLYRESTIHEPTEAEQGQTEPTEAEQGQIVEQT